jgi:hypothetical protein
MPRHFGIPCRRSQPIAARLALTGAITIQPRRGWLRRIFNRLFRGI